MQQHWGTFVDQVFRKNCCVLAGYELSFFAFSPTDHAAEFGFLGNCGATVSRSRQAISFDATVFR